MASRQAIDQFRYCWICAAEFAEPWPREGDWIAADCSGCGKYRISGTLYATGFPLADSERYRLSYVLKQRTIDGLAPLELTTHTLPALLAGLPNPATHEKAGILLLSFARLHPKPGGPAFRFDEVREYSLACARDDQEALFFLAGLQAANLISSRGGAAVRHNPHRVGRSGPLSGGYAGDLEALLRRARFREDMLAVYESGIAPAIERAGFEPRIANEPKHNEPTDARIVAEIRLARFVVGASPTPRPASTSRPLASDTGGK